jgi:hypothetical protein
MRNKELIKATNRFLTALIEGDNINAVWEELKSELSLNDADLQRALERAEDAEAAGQTPE